MKITAKEYLFHPCHIEYKRVALVKGIIQSLRWSQLFATFTVKMTAGHSIPQYDKFVGISRRGF